MWCACFSTCCSDEPIRDEMRIGEVGIRVGANMSEMRVSDDT